MRKVIKKSLIVLLAIAVTVTFTPMFSFGSAYAAAKVKAPVTFSGTAPSAKAIKLNWSKSKGATKYVVYRNGKKFKEVKNNYFTDKNVKKGKIYKYKVKAMKGKALSPATYVIKIKAKKGTNATKVKLNKTKVTLDAGKTVTLKATLTPAKAVKGIVWKTSNKAVATVSKGTVTAKKAGTATITARAASGKTAKCRITVKAPPEAAALTGTYIGNNNDGVQEFLGIPYGQAEQYKAPTDVSTTTKDRIETKEWGPNCLQDIRWLPPTDPFSRDCLYMNVWTKDVNTKDKPVLVFIHGGGTADGATDKGYDGEYFVRNLPAGEDCVMVTFTYRMSFLGACDLSSLEGYTDEYANAVNLTKLDQIQALKWINENIAAFGGDKDRVTLMGQSSGGACVQDLMSDPEANKYFKRVVQMSGVFAHTAISKEVMSNWSKATFDILGVKSIDELCALTDEQIVSNLKEINTKLNSYIMQGGRYADGLVTSETWWDDLKQGSAKDIDLMIGSTNGEVDYQSIDRATGQLVTDENKVLDSLRNDEASMPGVYGRCYMSSVDGFADEYLALGDDKVRLAQDIANQLNATYPSYVTAKEQSKWNKNTYYYYWEYAPDPQEVIDYAGDYAEVSPWGRALHCMDYNFMFGNKEGYLEMTGDPAKMSDELIQKTQMAWYSFAKTGNPSNKYLDTEWKPFSENDQETMVITPDQKYNCVKDYRAAELGVLSKIRPYGEKVASEIYTNGKIYTVDGDDWDKNPAQAMAVGADGKILGVGSKEEMEVYRGDSTKTVNLVGKAIYPGFIDSHVHPPGTAMTDLYEINNYFDFKIPETMNTIQAFIDENPDLEVYWGSGFNYGMFGDYIGSSMPDAEHPSPKGLLDAVCADKPIILTSNDGHGRWLNSKALEVCNITRDTPPQVGGNIQKLADGEPNGILTDCSNLITLKKDYTEEMYDQGLKMFCETMNSWGYTGANTGGQSCIENAVNLDKRGELTMRINFASNVYPENTVEENIANLDRNIELAKDSENVLTKTTKFFGDGVVEGYTAFMTDPYVGTAAEEMGEDWVSAPKWASFDELKANMLAVQKKGIQIHVHAIGNAAVKMAVDGIEYAQLNAGGTDYRNVITHLQVVDNSDKVRMGSLGIIGALQPYWFMKEPDWYEPVDHNYLGTVRAWKEYPQKSLQDNGMRLTFSGDYPVSPVNNPFWAIESAVTRNLNNPDYYDVEDILNEDDPTYLLNPKERVSLKTAIEAYTINGAYQMYEEDLCGSLTPGKVADFIVLREDPMKIDILDMDSVKVLQTYKDGKLVYEAE